jgi:hypothetical protein
MMAGAMPQRSLRCDGWPIAAWKFENELPVDGNVGPARLAVESSFGAL